MNKEKNEGYTAFLYGITKNPHGNLTEARKSWWDGWEEALEEDVQNHEEWR